jgi:prepilin-type N-terminal cleavage/methylation domain-containing protein
MELEIKNKGFVLRLVNIVLGRPKNKKSLKGAGFTLIELLVAMFVFSIIIVSMAGIAVSSIKSQRKAFSLQNAQETSRYILESMNKEIRMSTINSAAGSGVNTLNITNSQSETFNYQFDNNSKRLLRAGQVLSPDNLEVTGAFYIEKSTFPNRSLVTVVMKIRPATTKTERQAEIYLQNTIAPRTY